MTWKTTHTPQKLFGVRTEFGSGDGVEEKPKIGGSMTQVSMRQMLEAGLHFGHQTRRWNPKMKPYIYGPRNGIYIINLDATMRHFRAAYSFIVDLVAKGGSIMFVGTKKQARDIIAKEAERCGMFYVDHRWLGGMMTNFQTIKNSVERLKKIETMKEDGTINRFPKKEILKMEKELVKLDRTLGGIKNMRTVPDAIFVIDPRNEDIAIGEAGKLNIPVVALTDTNCNPDGIDYLIPGNDDAIRSIKLITSLVAEAVLEGKEKRGEEDVSAEAMEEEMQTAQTADEPVEQTKAEESTEASEGAEGKDSEESEK